MRTRSQYRPLDMRQFVQLVDELLGVCEAPKDDDPPAGEAKRVSDDCDEPCPSYTGRRP